MCLEIQNIYYEVSVIPTLWIASEVWVPLAFCEEICRCLKIPGLLKVIHPAFTMSKFII